MPNLKVNNILSSACTVILIIVVSYTPVVDAKLYSLDRNQEIIDLWNNGLNTLDKIGSNKKNTLRDDINEIELARSYFTTMPKDHLLRELGLAAVNIRKMNVLYFAKMRSGVSQYISDEMTKSAEELVPAIKLVQDFTPEKWGKILDIFPEITKFAEYLNSYYAIVIQLYGNSIRNEKDYEQFMSAYFEATYIMAAARMDKKKYSIEAAIAAIKQVRNSMPYKLDDEYFVIKYSLIAYAILYNNSCDGVLDLLEEPKKFIEYKINHNLKLSEELQGVYDMINLAETRCKTH